MEWKELWGVEVESSKSVSLKISISEGEDDVKVLGIRRHLLPQRLVSLREKMTLRYWEYGSGCNEALRSIQQRTALQYN